MPVPCPNPPAGNAPLPPQLQDPATLEDINISNAAVAPPWFQPALAAGLAPLTQVAYITHNLLSGDGHSHPFEVVPFLNGTFPTNPPHNLPPLVNVGVINALTGAQATAYLVGYGQPVPHLIAECLKAICIAVGCAAEI